MLSVESLTVRYGAVQAVRSVSMRVDEGETVALIGPNGAGKTSVLNAIVGLVPAASGRITFSGHELTGARTESIVRRGIALVPEHRRLFRNLTVGENLELGTTAGRGDGELRERLLSRFPILAARIDQQAGYLSGGEAQQLAIARALMGQPKLLLLDEPSLGLAPVLVEEVFRLVAELREQGMTILLVEQNAYMALDVADRAYIMRTGELEAERAASDLLDEDALLRTYLGAAESQ
jgi:branched-chain amino acid transport system ATP-binding protein